MKTLYIVGVIIIIIGCFLPWKEEGDFVSIKTNGIRIFPTIKDNGGVLLILLSLLLVWLVYRPPFTVVNMKYLILILSMIVVIDVVFHFFLVLRQHEAAKGIIGAPTIQIGLILVFIGSLINLSTTIYRFLKS